MVWGRPIDRDQLTSFLHKEVAECRAKLQRFRDAGIAVPYELDVACYGFNNSP